METLPIALPEYWDMKFSSSLCPFDWYLKAHETINYLTPYLDRS